jgi:hypothetical protein
LNEPADLRALPRNVSPTAVPVISTATHRTGTGRGASNEVMFTRPAEVAATIIEAGNGSN